jgi:beta-glucosidase/6-phospho-beta-glucosidase/beta-galactosidase
MINANHFGKNFTWGVAISAHQTEGAYLEDEKICQSGMYLVLFPAK